MLFNVTIIKFIPAFFQYIFVRRWTAATIIISFRISILVLMLRWSSLHVWLWSVSVGYMVRKLLCMIITVVIRQLLVIVRLILALSFNMVRIILVMFQDVSMSQSINCIILKLHLELSFNIFSNLDSMFLFSEWDFLCHTLIKWATFSHIHFVFWIL